MPDFIYISIKALVESSNNLSIFSFDFALVSIKGIPNESANCWPFILGTCLSSVRSHLLPTKILKTPSLAYLSTSPNHVWTCSNELLSVISYTITIPWAPL